MNKQISILAVEHQAERLALSVLSIIVGLLFCSYLYFVGASVLNIIARKEADAQSLGIQGSVGVLEEQYFALSQSVTPQDAPSLGLAPVSQTAYVYRPGDAAVAPIADDTEI